MERGYLALVAREEPARNGAVDWAVWARAALLLGCAILVVAATALPYVLAYLATPPGSQYVGLLSNPIDGNSYLAKMQEGARGEWLFHLPYTAEPHDGAFLFPFYLALGHLAAYLGLPVVLVYHAARLVGGVVLLLVGYRFLSALIEKTDLRILAWALFALGSGLGWLAAPLGYYSADLLVPESTSFHAIFANPHFPFATALLIGVFLLLLMGSRSHRVVWGLGAGVAALLLVLVQPFLALAVYAVSMTWLLLLYRARRALPRREAALVGLTTILSLPAVALEYLALYANPVLAQWTAQNQTPSPDPLNYVLGYGVLFPLAVAGVLALARKGMGQMLRPGGVELAGAWLVANSFLLYAPFALQRRFAEGLQMPMALFAALGAAAWVLPSARSTRGRRLLALAVVLMALPTNLFLLGVSAVGVDQASSGFYLSSEEVESFTWLTRQTSPADVVLASPQTGNLIPAWAGNRAYYGHPFETIAAESKLDRLRAFFGGAMSPEERWSFLRDAGVRYVYVGKEERKMGPFDPDGERYLTPSFSTESVHIYRVTP